MQYSQKAVRRETKGSYAFVSLGCPKNLVDSEKMLGLLQLDGYDLVQEPVGSDFVVVNTCGFIESARQESFERIDEMLELKRAGHIRGVIVSGCLAERQKEELLEERPDIDSLVGVFGRDEITKIADRLVGNQEEQRSLFQPAPVRALSDEDRFRVTPSHYGYIKISEGCDRLCTFCAIPKMRGKHASKPIEAVVAEAQQLAEDGVRELIIVAQDTTYYGIDIYGEPRLTELLQQLNQVEGFDWIRLMYFYPMYIDDRLIRTINDCERILPYIDIPLQHISDPVLRRMSRRVTRSQTEQLLSDLRSGIDNLSLRTTFITGFPGESDDDFAELAEFVAEQKFERMGVFTYSLEPDTPAARLPDHVDQQLMEERRDQLMAIQQQVSFEHAEAQLGKQLDVILDRPVEEPAQPSERSKKRRRRNKKKQQPVAWIGRSAADAPDVDALVYVTPSEHRLKSGDLVKCEIVASQGYDLAALAVEKPRRQRQAKVHLPVLS